MPGRIEMRRAMRGQPYPFEAPAFAVGQVFLLQAGEKLEATSFSSGTEMSITLRAISNSPASWSGLVAIARVLDSLHH